MQPVSTDDRTALLIADYLEPDPTDPRVTAYRLRGSRLPVRQVMQHVTANTGDTQAIAGELGVFYRAVDAARAHYELHRDAFTAETAPAVPPITAASAPKPRFSFPWWLQFVMLLSLGVASMVIGVALATVIR